MDLAFNSLFTQIAARIVKHITETISSMGVTPEIEVPPKAPEIDN